MKGVAAARYELVDGWGFPPADLAYRDAADVAVDSRDRVYVLTRNNPSVSVYDQAGDFITSWVHDLVGPGGHGIAVDAEFNVYVVDWLEHFVAKFTSDGRLLSILGTPGHGADNGIEPWPPVTLPYPVERLSTLRATGPFNGCTGVAVGRNGDLYISDGYGNARIHRFTAAGELIDSVGAAGTGELEFHNPHSVHVGDDDMVYVSDRENDRVQVLTLDLDFASEVPVQRPASAAVDQRGRLIVASLRYAVGETTFTRGQVREEVPDRLTVLDAGGSVVYAEAGVIHVPNGLAVDSGGDIYVAQVAAYHAVNTGVARRPVGSLTSRAASAPSHVSSASAIAKFRRVP